MAPESEIVTSPKDKKTKQVLIVKLKTKSKYCGTRRFLKKKLVKVGL